jgi:hypothetical protein
MVAGSSAASSSVQVAGYVPPTQLSTAASASALPVVDAYAFLIDGGGIANSTVSPTYSVTVDLLSAGNAASSLQSFFDLYAEAAANAQGTISNLSIPQLVVDAAIATSQIVENTIAVFETADSSAEAVSFASLGLALSLDVDSAAAAGSAIVLLQRVMTEGPDDSSAVASDSDTFNHSQVSTTFMLLSTADSSSLVQLSGTFGLFIQAEASTEGTALYRNPDKIAWVINTETAAAAWYNNFDFESIAQPNGANALAVGPDGIYEMTGSDDDGVKINSTVQSGFTDFGDPHQKRVDAFYFGYTSTGQLSETVEVMDSYKNPATYILEQRSASQPRNSRIQVGKGLFGRYWRMTLNNVDGADFEISDASADIAVSNRRV